MALLSPHTTPLSIINMSAEDPLCVGYYAKHEGSQDIGAVPSPVTRHHGICVLLMAKDKPGLARGKATMEGYHGGVMVAL